MQGRMEKSVIPDQSLEEKGLLIVTGSTIRAEEGDTVILTWDINFLSADYSGGWFNAALQFVGEDQVVLDFQHNVHTEPQDVWLTHSITQVVTAAQADSLLQVHFEGSGMWIDNVSLKHRNAHFL